MQKSFLSIMIVLSKGKEEKEVGIFAAGDTTGVLSGLLNLKSLVLGIITVVGVIYLVWGISEFATALSDRDSSSMKSAGYKIAGGLLMALAGSIVTFLGIAE